MRFNSFNTMSGNNLVLSTESADYNNEGGLAITKLLKRVRDTGSCRFGNGFQISGKFTKKRYDLTLAYMAKPIIYISGLINTDEALHTIAGDALRENPNYIPDIPSAIEFLLPSYLLFAFMGSLNLIEIGSLSAVIQAKAFELLLKTT